MRTATDDGVEPATASLAPSRSAKFRAAIAREFPISSSSSVGMAPLHVVRFRHPNHGQSSSVLPQYLQAPPATGLEESRRDKSRDLGLKAFLALLQTKYCVVEWRRKS